MPEKITTAFIRRPKLTIFFVLGVCALLWAVGWNFQTQKGIDSVLDTRGGQRELYEKASQLGEIDRTVLVDIECADIFSVEGLSLVRGVTEAFLAADHVASVKSLTHSVMPVRRGLSFSFEPLVPPPPWTAEQLESIERFCLNHPFVRHVMVAENGRRALVAVEYEPTAFASSQPEQLRAEAREILALFEREGVRLRMIGLPFAELEIRERVTGDMILLATGALFLAAAVLRLAFLGWRLAASLLLAHLLYLSIMPGLFRIAGYQPEPFALALLPLLGAIQLTLLVHIGSAFDRALAGDFAGAEALERGVSETGRSCLFATLTTMAGFFALTVSTTDSIRDLGLWGAAGVGAGFLFSFGPALAILSLGQGGNKRWAARERRRRARYDFWRRGSARGAGFVRRRSAWLIGIAAVLVVATAPGILLLKPDVRLESFLPAGSELQEAVLLADAEYGGLQVAQIDFDSGARSGITGRAFLEQMWAAHRRAEAIPEVTAVYSYPQILAVLNQVWHGSGTDELRLPDEGWLLAMFTGGLEAFNLPLLGAVVDEERRIAHLVLRMPSVSSARYLEIVETVLGEARADAPEPVAVRAGGMVHAFLASDRAVVRAQLFSSLAVFAAVAVLLLLLWRTPSLAVKGLAVTILPVAATLGIAGYAGVTLNGITVMAGAIAAGVAVDDAVHFITCWRDSRRRLDDAENAVEEVLLAKGPPIVCTSIILIGAFALLGFSSFQPVAQLGFMAAGALALTLPAILVVLPALLRCEAKQD